MEEHYTNDASGSPDVLVQVSKIEGQGSVNVTVASDAGLRGSRPVVPVLLASVPLWGAGALLLTMHGRVGLVGVLLVAAGLVLAGLGVSWLWLARWQKHATGDDRLKERARFLAGAVRTRYRQELEQADADGQGAIAVRWGVPDGVRQAAGAEGFRRDGEFGEAAELFRSVPTRRLVILGAAGAGKSVFATALASQLLGPGGSAGPVPVVVSLRGWVPSRQRLLHWAARRIAAAHREIGRSVADARLVTSGLLASRRVLLVLDGLDEIPAEARAAALEELNRQGTARLPLVLTSRPDEYAAAVEDAGMLLAGAAVVELRPLVAGQIAASLPLTDPSPDAPSRWRPVLDALEADGDGPVKEALASPLMVGLARTAYRRASDDPAELLEFSDAESLENQLLERFVPAAYADESEERVEDVRRWLGFLAWHLRENDEDDLEWWRLDEAVPAVVRALGPASALVAAGAVIAGLGYRIPHRYWIARDLAPHAGSVPVWALFPLLAYLGVVTWSQLARDRWLMGPLRVRGPRGVRHALNRRERGGGTGGLYAMPVVAALFAGLGVWVDGPLGRFAAVSALLVAVAVLWRFAWWFGEASDPAEAEGPPGMLRRDRDAALALGWNRVLEQVWPLPLLLSAPFLLALRWEHRLDPASLGPAFALTLAVLWYGGVVLSSWGRFRVAHAWLTLRGRTPHDLMAFLEEAQRLGVLRQSGGGYRFRHGALRDRLAEEAEASRRPPRPRTEPRLLSDGRAMAGMQALCLVMLYLCAFPGLDGGHVVGALRWVQRHSPSTVEIAACDMLRPHLAGLVGTPLEVDRGRRECRFVEGDPLRPALTVSLGIADDPGSPDVNQQGQNDPAPDSPPSGTALSRPRDTAVAATLSTKDYTLEIRSEVPDPRVEDRAMYVLDQVLRGAFPKSYKPGTRYAPPGPLPTSSDERFRLYDAHRPARIVVGPTWAPGDWSRLWALQDLGFAFRGPVFGQCVREGGRWYCVQAQDTPAGEKVGPFQLEIEQRPCQGSCPPPAEPGWRRSDASTWYAERWDGHAYTLDTHAVRAGKSLDVRVATSDTRADLARKTVNDISAQSSR
ncbi:NACHT domain-containing protein [Actinomadura harenae]|uniref:NACHT domain-containing protein n=1 Tax=Actinomadura harenae TaxID=2483351 RepID=A0A3M2LLE9_9ACTN|nr:NACHT domain-containing protein [Actinomadura harenae]RMI38254.1 NACHT domain-containing protein [Actinomadura harenae]